MTPNAFKDDLRPEERAFLMKILAACLSHELPPTLNKKERLIANIMWLALDQIRIKEEKEKKEGGKT